MQVSYSIYDLLYDHFGLLLVQLFIFFKVAGKIGALTKLKHRAERVCVYFNCIEQFYYVGVAQQFVHVVLSEGVFDIILFSI